MRDNIWCLLHLCNKSVSNNILYRGVDLIKMYICCVDVTMELSFRLCVRERDVFLEQVSDLLCYIYMHHFYSFLVLVHICFNCL